MTINDPDKIDFISTTRRDASIRMTVSDHLEWEPLDEHVDALQTKIGRYIDFIESGQLVREYPAAEGRKIAIHVVCKHPPPESARPFIEYLNAFLDERGIGFVIAGSVQELP